MRLELPEELLAGVVRDIDALLLLPDVVREGAEKLLDPLDEPDELCFWG